VQSTNFTRPPESVNIIETNTRSPEMVDAVNEMVDAVKERRYSVMVNAGRS
jgi:hypothetical protein